MNECSPPNGSEVPRLTAALEAKALRAVATEYFQINAVHFRGVLVRPQLAFTDSLKKLGQWSAHPPLIELSRVLLGEHGWIGLVEVLRHEMAHQYVAQVLGVTGETAHGAVFRRVCAERGFDALAAGEPDTAGASATPQGRVLERVAKLLALAQSSNEHEAQAAASAAQRLMLRYNLDELASQGAATYRTRHVGLPTARVAEHQRWLAEILGDHFFVETLWIRVWRPAAALYGSVLELSGTSANLEIAAYVHDFLLTTAERLWREHKRETGIRVDRDRRAFIAGVMQGFGAKLKRDAKTHAEQGLVWVGDAGLEAFMKARHPRIRSITFYGSGESEARRHGQQAGKEIVLRQGLNAGSSGQAPRLLGR